MLSTLIAQLSPQTIWFIGAACIAAFILCASQYFQWKSASADVRSAPNVLTTFMTLCVFAGTAVVLAHMDTDNAQRILLGMPATTLEFIGAIVFFAVYFHCNYTQSIAYKAPAVLTTFGILGTFIGIAIGLENFDTSDIQKSVPALIDGIKMAFWASACGILAALTIKLRDILSGSGRTINSTRSSGATIDDLATLLKSIQLSLAGGDESALTSQISRARQESNDRMDKLSHALNDITRQAPMAQQPGSDAKEAASARASETPVTHLAALAQLFADHAPQTDKAPSKLEAVK